MQEWSPELNRMLSTMETRENRQSSSSYKAKFLYYFGCLKMEKSLSIEDITGSSPSEYVDNPIKSDYHNMNN
tara:strand:- start:622 stop:837 length:216 start_codon:yes stop_codon:yes gene_type:complete